MTFIRYEGHDVGRQTQHHTSTQHKRLHNTDVRHACGFVNCEIGDSHSGQDGDIVFLWAVMSCRLEISGLKTETVNLHFS